MTKMHKNELAIEAQLVRELLKNQCPQWANLALMPVPSSGTDNALFRLGNDYVVRLPRIEWSPGSVTRNIHKEWQFLPQIAKHLTLAISEPVFKGNPSCQYPWPWTVNKWHEGENPGFEKENEYALLAKDLALFLQELHHIKGINGPLSRRGISLKTKALNEETRFALQELDSELDIQPLALLWEHLADISYWDKEPVWVHGDFLPGNILVQEQRLKAVIDFADVGIGDPACDLIIAWSLLGVNSRKIFKENLEHVDEATWERGRGWALSIALIMLPYYKNSNPVLAKLARRMLEQVQM